MRSIFFIVLLVLSSFPAFAWNGAGHRLVAAVAWRQMSPSAQQSIAKLLRRHPDYPGWTAKAGGRLEYAAFLGASTWPDDIRNDPRFYDEKSEVPTRSIAGIKDTARHKSWHYIDRFSDGRQDGELDNQLRLLIRRIGDPAISSEEIAYALPWLIHLLGDIHQPLHVGSHDDQGGNRVEIENPFNPRQPFTNLHSWWDDLPGPPWLRGERLEKAVDMLLTLHPTPPRQGTVTLWEEESRQIGMEQAYPNAVGSLLPIITEDFRTQSRAIANRRLAEAGYRLGHLLQENFGGDEKVPRETE